ncbi:PA3496 family putative envelope integrity protein [Halomonas sp.]|uniref:PA3496 family putative envelope integrity protein n=1 Tax=Halomonas sp. TaxID=1486246 RepID=UPI003D0C7CF2
MGREPLLDPGYDDDQELTDAVNDDDYVRPRATSRADTLRARRRVEALLEERRLRRAIEDDWAVDEEE